MKRPFVLTLILLAAPAVFGGPNVPEGEIPFGAWLLHRQTNDYVSYLGDMRDSLGFNYVYHAAADSLIDYADQHDILVLFRPLYTGDPNLGDNFLNYERSHYLKIEAEESGDTTRFLTRDGYNDGEWFVPDPNNPAGQRTAVLDNLKYFSKRLYIHSWIDVIDYHTSWCMKAEYPDLVDEDDTVAVFTAFYNDSPIDSTIIMGDQFTDNQPDTIACFTYSLPDNGQIRFKLDTYNNCGLKIDWFKVYNDEGQQCIDEGVYDQAIAGYVDDSEFEETIMYWFLRDEPLCDNVQPMVHIADIIRSSTASAFGDTTYDITSFPRGTGNQDMLKYFLQKSDPNPPIIWKQMYSFDGQYYKFDEDSCWKQTITGYTGAYYDSGNRRMGLQQKLNGNICNCADTLQAMLGDSVSWWMLAAAHEEYFTDPSCNGEGQYRYPTKSELSCEVFMGFCHGAKGIGFYNYAGTTYTSKVYNSIRDSSLAATHLWEKIHDDINPYLKAIGNAYLDLTWLEAGYTDTLDHDPDVGIISNIKIVPNSPNSLVSPDTGWTHVGVYSDDYNYYFMLVNRACSKDEDGNEAGSVTAIVQFDRGWFAESQLLVIDIANSVSYNAAESAWVAVPETTYTAVLPDFPAQGDSSLYFTTVLRAGEGRLFKIADVTGSR